ncbi:MAG TPA: histidine phosphatase family protein [Opitutaceae bacterium]
MILPAKAYLVRHGATTWSQSGQHTGTTDVPLLPEGEERARQMGLHLGSIEFGLVLVSPRKRARRTCELAGLGAHAQVEPDLAEWNYGDYEGLKSAQILKDNPDWCLFRDGCPGGESPAQVSDRADRLIGKIRSAVGNVALFSHGHFGRVLAARWISLPVLEARSFLLDTACLGVFGYEHDNPDQPVLSLWNYPPSGEPPKT